MHGSLVPDAAPGGPVELCLCASGAWFVAAGGRFVGKAIDAHDPFRVRYERGRLRDRLIVDGATLAVPAGKAAAVRSAIALGRVRRRGSPEYAVPLGVDRYLQTPNEAARELVARSLGQPDTLIALTELAAERLVSSALGAEVPAKHYFALSAQRALVFSLSELGDVELVEPRADDLGLQTGEGRAELRVATERIAVNGRERALLEELLELLPLGGGERAYEAARRLFVQREGHAPARVRTLLDAAAELEHARARFAQVLVSAELDGTSRAKTELSSALRDLRTQAEPANAVAESYTRWSISAEAARKVLTLLTALGAEAEPWALALHRTLHANLKEPGVHADLELAEHELAAGQPALAGAIVRTRLSSWSSDEEVLLMPARASDAGRTHARLLDVLRIEAELRGTRDFDAIAALARLAPWEGARLSALAELRSDDPREQRVIARASDVLAALSAGGLAADTADDAPESLPSLAPDSLNRQLRHPLAQRGRFAARLSELLAATPEPDLGFLRDFCEELSSDRHPRAMRALERARRLLDIPAVRVYVSHGERSVGLRAFGAREPFVLIGQSHLAASHAASLCGAELDFAFGAELSHLAFGHQRVTASEVWMGAASKTRDALIAASVLMPLLSELGGQRAQKWFSRIAPEALGRAAEKALNLDKLFGAEKRLESAIGQHNEELIAAHRLVQLSADRVGLVACGRLGPALRAMLLTRSAYHPLLNAAERGGLLELLNHAETSAAVADLGVRIRALIAFYLSFEFDLVGPGRLHFGAH